jgi:hypothetical protein
MAKPIYRSASVERTTSAGRGVVFDTALATVGNGAEILSQEPPWRLVTSDPDGTVDLHETTVAIVDAPGDGTLFSVSAVIGPEVDSASLDHRLRSVVGELDRRADAIRAIVEPVTT